MIKKVCDSENFILFLLCLFSGIFIIFAISNLSISYNEAYIFFNKIGISGYLSRISCKIFGQNDLALRLPFLILFFANSILIYKISKFILKRKFDRIFAVVIFMFLPATLTSAIVVNNAVIVIFFILLSVYFFESNFKFCFYFTLFLTFFVDKSLVLLHIATFFYMIYLKNKFGSIFLFLILIFDFLTYDFEIYGKPKGYFLDVFGIYAGAFSPFVFLFFIYAIYRIWIKENKNLLWFIVIFSFCLSIILSLRQKVFLEYFLPFCIISVPLIIKVFLNSYRIRLPQFRKFHKISLFCMIFFLFLTSFFTIFNQILYANIFKNNPEKHFIYKFDVAKELAKILKENKINNVSLDDKNLALRLKFYGIENKGKVFLSQNCDFSSNLIEIKKFGANLGKFCFFSKND